MNSTADRYILCMQHAEPITMKMQDHQPALSTFATFFEALLTMLNQPIDAFDAASARKAGLPHYIQECTITDAANGTTVCSIARLNTEEPVYKNTLVFLEFDSEAIHHFFPDQFITVHRQQGSPVWMPFLAVAPQGQLYLTSMVQTMTTQAPGHFVDIQKCHSPNEWIVSWDGFCSNHPLPSRDSLALPSLTVAHLVPSEQAAARILLNLPSPAFDFSFATREKLPHFVNNATVSKRHSGEVTMFTHTVGLPSEHDLHSAMDAGRYLGFPKGWVDGLNRMGFPYLPDSIPYFSSEAIKVDYFSTSNPPQLKPTHLLEQIRDHFAKNSEDTERLRYCSSVIYEKLAREEENPLSPVLQAQYHDHYHCDNLLTAICHALEVQVMQLDPALKEENEEKGIIVSAGVKTSSGESLVRYELRIDDQQESGLYLHFASSLAADPALAHPTIQHALQTNTRQLSAASDDRSIRISEFREGELILTAEFQRLEHAFITSNTLLQAEARPEVRFPLAANVDPKDQFILRFHWESMVRSFDQDPAMHIYQVGYPDFRSAVKALADIDSRNFDLQGRILQLAHLTLAEASVIQRSDAVTLVSRYSVGTNLTVEMNTGKMDDQQRTVVEELIVTPGSDMPDKKAQKERRLAPLPESPMKRRPGR